MSSSLMEAPMGHTQAEAQARVPLPWLLPGLLTGGLLWLCYFPLGWSWLAWIALVPLLSLVRLDVSPGKVFLGAYLAGLAFFGPALQWMRVADYRMYATWAMLTVYCSLYFPAAILLIRLLDRRTRLPLVLSVPLAWTGLEFARSFVLGGFAWYFLGHSQHALLGLIQIADVTGVYGISFLVVAVNAWVFDLTRACVSRNTVYVSRSLMLQGAALIATLVLFLGYGAWRLEQNDFRPGPRLALLQGNVDQRIRNEATSPNNVDSRKRVFDYYKALCERACYTVPPPELVVWPETSFPYPWLELPQDLNKVSKDDRQYGEAIVGTVKDLVRKTRVAHLLGLNAEVLDEDGKLTKYNSALLFHAPGYAGERYDKIHRVPFGEFLPLREWLPFMDYFSPYPFEYSILAGEHLTRFTLGDFRFGVIICYEDTDPFLARAYGIADRDGPAVDFLLNISNDGWFDGTSEHEEHLALCRFRAIECRRAVARSVNMGISAIIDSNGRVRKPERLPQYPDLPFWVVPDQRHVPDLPEEEWSRYKKVDGILSAVVPIDNRASLYSRYGDWFPWSCWAIVVGCFGWSRFRQHQGSVRSASTPPAR